MKHTPGPWVTAKYSAKRFGLGNPGGSAWALIQTIDTDTDDPEMRANARLIAAAPDLLRLLRIAYDDLRELGFCTVLPEIDEILTRIEGKEGKDLNEP